VIIDLEKFVRTEEPYWRELEEQLERMEADPHTSLTLEEVRRFHYLFERAAGDLAKFSTYASEPELRAYLENLVARAYSEIHETRKVGRVHPWRWFTRTFPATFRAHVGAFWLSLLLTGLGVAFGAGLFAADPAVKASLLPPQFGHLQESPSERVAREEARDSENQMASYSTFSSMLIANNTRVSINALALGFTYGIGTLILLFYNGVILGVVSLDYLLDGQLIFLLGWLLPHGAVEIPCILIAGQAGLVLAGTLIGRGSGLPLRRRFRKVAPDLVTLIIGVAVLLVWAGIVEAFFSQFHAPRLPYSLKILFGSLELAGLIAFLSWSGRKSEAGT
jgi:uncharacterized membrane protein SpoIIM required for sporulation